MTTERPSTTAPTPAEQVVEMERVFDAPRALVFEVWTTPGHLMRWWGPMGCTVPVCQMDVRPGGVWHYCMQLPDGSRDWLWTVYDDVVLSERLILTSTFVDEQGKPVERPDRPNEIRTTVTFADAEEEGKTKLTVRQSFVAPALMRRMTQQGWTETLDRLADHLARS